MLQVSMASGGESERGEQQTGRPVKVRKKLSKNQTRLACKKTKSPYFRDRDPGNRAGLLPSVSWDPS